MRNRKRNRLKSNHTVLFLLFGIFAIYLSAKIIPNLSSMAIVSAGINMPNFKKPEAVEEKSQIQSAVLCDIDTDFSSTQAVEKTVENEERGDGEIIYKQYKKMSGDNFIDLSAGQIRNCTTLSNGEILKAAKLSPEFSIEANSEPQVLIYHTHATESYEPCERNYYISSHPTRSTDKSQNMVAVGDAITDELTALGIGVIHSDELHDHPSYTGSYANSAETIKKVLKEYPSIKVVLDIHRDAIESDGARYAAVAEIDGKYASQLMIISGCDDGTMDYPNYMQNLRLASLFQQQIESDYPGLTRPILFDYRKYNQNLSTGGLLFEIGSHGNTLEQSVYSGHLIGKSIGKALLSLSKE